MRGRTLDDVLCSSSRGRARLLAAGGAAALTLGLAPVVVSSPSAAQATPDSQAAAATSTTTATAAGATDPRRRLGLFVDPYMPAAQAGSEFRRIGSRAQALWITDYYREPATARRAVVDYTRRARQAGKTPMMAIYAIPGRDCGLYSSGGLPDAKTYRTWITAVAAGMKGTKAMVVLEPDAVPFMGDPRCVDAAPRQKLLTFAARQLSRAGAWVYVDAGHSGWRSAAQIAGLLTKSGIRYARGFSTNVGNYRPTGAEQRYAAAVNRELAERGVRGKKFVVETARNGGGTPVDGDVCNPTWARIGAAPRLVFRGAFDGTLWIKHPGESDGPCNGGPSSGAWWPEGARRLMGSR